MNELCMIIKDTVKPNFLNIRTSIRTYDRDALCCGAPCWRWAYHALHSADKWFINPFDYEEPPFHVEGLDNPDNPCDVILSDEELLSYLDELVEHQEKKHRTGKLPLKRSVREQELISRTKQELMKRNRRTEAEAHRYLQKTSMDSGTGLTETAQMILRLMGEDPQM